MLTLETKRTCKRSRWRFVKQVEFSSHSCVSFDFLPEDMFPVMLRPASNITMCGPWINRRHVVEQTSCGASWISKAELGRHGSIHTTTMRHRRKPKECRLGVNHRRNTTAVSNAHRTRVESGRIGASDVKNYDPGLGVDFGGGGDMCVIPKRRGW